MSEILIRGRREDNGEWVYGYGAIDDEVLTLDFAKGIVRVPCQEGTVGQYTGVKDQNEKMIFEGDRVKCVALSNDHNQRGAVNVVTVRKFYGSFCLCLDGCDSGATLFPFCVDHTLEVIE